MPGGSMGHGFNYQLVMERCRQLSETDTKDSGRFRLNTGTNSYVQYSTFFTGLIFNTGTDGSVTSYTGDSWAFTQPVGGADVVMTVKFHI